MRLATNDTVTMPGVVVFVDTETTPRDDPDRPGRQLHSLMLGCATAGRVEGGRLTRRKTLDFDSPLEFWEWVESLARPEKPVWIFAHNLGFDLGALAFWQLVDAGTIRLSRRRLNTSVGKRKSRTGNESHRIERGLLVTDDPPTIVLGWIKSTVKIWCLDTLNWWPMSLAKLGALVDIPKRPLPEPGDSRDEWRAYCRNDVEIITEAVCRWALWQRRQELGRFAFTIAGQAMAGFRHRWMRHDIDLPEAQEQRDAERDGNYTGRTEALFCGQAGFEGGRQPGDEDIQQDLFRPVPRGPFHLLDAYSFYGSLLLETDVPVKTLRVVDCRGGGEIDQDTLTRNCCARVLIESESERFPARTARGVIWPVGSYWTTLHGLELLRALVTGSVKRCNWAAWYQTAPIFDTMGADLWGEMRRAREAGDRFALACVKSIMARIAGKFSQRDSEWVLRPDLDAPERWACWQTINAETGEVNQYRAIGWDVEQRQPPQDAPICWPAITAFVTAAGRERLLRWMRTAGESETLYVATDSLIVTQRGFDRLNAAGFVAADSLGFLRCQQTADTVEIRGPGSYRIGDINKHMGRDVRGRDIGNCLYQTERFAGMRAMMRLEGACEIPVDRVILVLPKRSPVGTVRPDGWIEPVRLTESEGEK